MEDMSKIAIKEELANIDSSVDRIDIKEELDNEMCIFPTMDIDINSVNIHQVKAKIEPEDTHTDNESSRGQFESVATSLIHNGEELSDSTSLESKNFTNCIKKEYLHDFLQSSSDDQNFDIGERNSAVSTSAADKNCVKDDAELVSNLIPHQCDICEKYCGTAELLNRHKLTHPRAKPFQCDVCKKRYATADDLKTHNLTHSDVKPQKCDICNKCFIRADNLNKHKLTHPQCDVCQKRFNKVFNLNQHKLTHSGENQCHVCNKGFIKVEKLNKHTLTHPQCDVCLKRFNKVTDLNQHKLIHCEITSLWGNQCHNCKKVYIRIDSLSKHKCHQCDVCKKFFKKATQLEKHKLRHSKDETPLM